MTPKQGQGELSGVQVSNTAQAGFLFPQSKCEVLIFEELEVEGLCHLLFKAVP